MKFIKNLYKKILKFFKNRHKEMVLGKLYLLENEAVCPNCSGCVKKMASYDAWKCNDCKTVFAVLKDGSPENDREVLVIYYKNKEER